MSRSGNMTAQKSVNIVWFKRDLRIHDHAPLTLAAAAGKVLPIYIVEPDYWRLPDSSRRHWMFIHDCLVELREDLQKLGLTFHVRVGEAADLLDEFQKGIGKFKLWSHEETGNAWTYERDKRIARWCRNNSIEWDQSPTNGVVRRLESRDGWATLRNHRMAAPRIAVPAAVAANEEFSTGDIPSKGDPLFGEPVSHVQTGGRKEGLKTIASFLNVRAQKYIATLSKPGLSARYSSRLGPHLAFGTLSSREVEQATRTRLFELANSPEPEAKHMRKNLSHFLSRLAWRCHFMQKLEQQPEIETHCMHQAFEGMREPHFREDFFFAWKMGLTGYPLVDACMRSLYANGWINFRMRAMLVSFASYHLWLDWRVTAPHLAQLFTDYEPGIHLSQFQMQSGVTGINAVRIYNPVKQSLDQDPEGKFIRRYVPELADVSMQWIHEPWRLPYPPASYPKPIVDHGEVTKHARNEIARRRHQSGFITDADAVFQKLGSRTRASERVPKPLKDKDQFNFEL